MLADEILRIVEDSTRKLFQVAPPPVRYYVLTDLWSRRTDDPLVLRTLLECERYPLKLRLLERMREDGTWPISKARRTAEERGPGPPFGWTYITLLRNLNDLADMKASASEGRIGAALATLLGWQTEEGYLPGPWHVPFGLPNYNGLALRALLMYGLESDARVQRLTSWLLRCQRADGGWLIPYVQDMKYLPRFAHMRKEAFLELVRRGEVPRYDPQGYDDIPSCVWTTFMVVRGLCQSYELSRRREVRRGAEFILDRFFRRNYHPTFHRAASHWTRLAYPCYAGSGLCALDILTWLGFGANDERMERPIRWLMDMRGPDGLWHRTGRPSPDDDPWISEIALSVLNRYAQSLSGEPFGLKAELIKERGCGSEAGRA